MRVKALGKGNRQLGPADRPKKKVHQVAVGDKLNCFALGINDFNALHDCLIILILSQKEAQENCLLAR